MDAGAGLSHTVWKRLKLARDTSHWTAGEALVPPSSLLFAPSFLSFTVGSTHAACQQLQLQQVKHRDCSTKNLRLKPQFRALCTSVTLLHQQIHVSVLSVTLFTPFKDYCSGLVCIVFVFIELSFLLLIHKFWVTIVLLFMSSSCLGCLKHPLNLWYHQMIKNESINLHNWITSWWT